MIIKGNSRGGASQLARHLLRADTNERVKIIELQSPLDDLGDTLRDWQLISTGTKGKKGLYHANISPDHYEMTPAQWLRCVETLETELGFTGQPRAIVLHEKEGREHIHVVWQRTDIDTMTLKSDSQNYQAHERASLSLEEEFGHEMVPGKHAKRDREEQPEFPRAKYNLDEAQQFERNNIDPEQFKITLTAIYHQSDTAPAFKAALEDNGLILAIGDNGSRLVIVDQEGEVYSLGRQLLDVKAKELKKFMKDMGQLPDVEQATALHEAKKIFRQSLQPAEQQQAPKPPEPPEQKPPDVDMSTQTQPEKDPQLEKLEAALRERHAKETRERVLREGLEIERLLAAHKTHTGELLEARRRVQKLELDRFNRKAEEHSDDWVRKYYEVAKHKWNPAAAEQQRIERERQLEEIKTRHRIEQETLIETRNLQRVSAIRDLMQRQLQEAEEQINRNALESQRYKQEHENARKISKEMEEERQKEERTRKPDEPDPPKYSL